ncbi:MAG: TIGR02281 family clan AA aspartic protease [Pseudomonadales bacterium]|nr:TIGR02281 family clan AA aspartic protease [Pseudomonadales bacterium]
MSTNTLKSFIGLTILAVSSFAHAMAPVEVVALFKDRAVIRSSEGQAMLRVGETSKFGAYLISADPHTAKVRYKGELYNVGLSTRVSGGFVEPEIQSVRLNEDSMGQYRMRGSIDGTFVNFLVDTGASVVAMSEHHARMINLDYRRAQKGTVQTAQGVASAYFLRLSEVTLGGITINGVQATVIEGGYPTDVLLGMSFLSKLNMQNNNGVLVLSARH